MKHIAILAMLLVLAVSLIGCQFTGQYDISLTANQTTGHPTMERGGFPVTFVISGVGDKGEIDYGDGQTEAVSDGKVTHVYRVAGEYTAILTRGNQHVSVDIRLTNNPPHVAPPAGNHKSYEWHEYAQLYMDHRLAGCHNGTPQTEYGAYDPDGDPLTFTWSLVEDNGRHDTIFSPTKEVITDKEGPYWHVAFFAGYDGDAPLFPYLPFSAMRLEQTPTVKCGPTPQPPPTPEPSKYNATLKCIVRDGVGGETTYEQRIYIQRSTCKSSS